MIAVAQARARKSWLDDPDVALMLQVQNDDREAFAQLVEQYSDKVFGRFYRRLADRQEAEDLRQEVFLRVYRHRHRYRPTAKFATWLFHIAQNVLRNALRSRQRHPCVHLEALAGSSDYAPPGDRGLPVSGDAPSQPLERAEAAHIVRTAVNGLANRQRQAVQLHQFQDWTYAEVAAEMDMTPKAAKSLLYRAHNQLRASLTAFMES